MLDEQAGQARAASAAEPTQSGGAGHASVSPASFAPARKVQLARAYVAKVDPAVQGQRVDL